MLIFACIIVFPRKINSWVLFQTMKYLDQIFPYQNNWDFVTTNEAAPKRKEKMNTNRYHTPCPPLTTPQTKLDTSKKCVQAVVRRILPAVQLTTSALANVVFSNKSGSIRVPLNQSRKRWSILWNASINWSSAWSSTKSWSSSLERCVRSSQLPGESSCNLRKSS